MSATTLIDDLRQRGFALTPEGNGIRITPASALTDADRAAIRAHKAALLELLTTDPRVSGQPCPTCGGALLSESGDGWQRVWCPSPDHHFSEFDGLGAFTGHAARQIFEGRWRATNARTAASR
ncbi:MAG TPA: hypothetical protein VNQ79_21415 [Blastocatellia bacterium]|nr:hypothetical protein [Blastocatellia bacterium]